MPTTPNMNMVLPTPTVTNGPEWATEVNAALTDQVDTHDHSPGKGVPIAASAIDIDADLPFNSNRATELKSTKFDTQVSTLTGALNVQSVYSYNGDLYYTNDAGIAVQVTDGNNVNTPPPIVPITYHTYTFELNGPYYVANNSTFPANDQGPRFIAPFDLDIVDVTIFSRTQGSGGTTEIDLKKSTSGSGTWTSIFDVTPKAGSTVVNDSWANSNTTVTGYTSPELSLTEYQMNENQALRCDIISVMTGSPEDIYITIKYKAT